MATYAYDDYRVTFSPAADGSYDVTAVDATGTVRIGTFRVPFSDDELAGAVQGAVAHARGGTTRDVGGAPAPALDAEQVGAALAGALLVGPIGDGYAAARTVAAGAGRGVRLSLSLAAAPALLSVPWEFLYQRPRFLASQRKSPVVRLLDTGALTTAPIIDSTVRILGVVAGPHDLAPLDVAKERAGVEAAVAPTRALGRVELDWLEPATPKRLREVLRDGSYHVLHYIGHSSFTDAGDGVVYLEADDGSSDPVDETLLANLLADQDLRLVVLNSCEGARTTLTDPYAGIATTLIDLGVPAVVAMQFEISDRAAIVFAQELYLNLVGRQAPIDAAIAEARKAVYSEVDAIEWATPVLFVRDPDVELFRFAVDAAPLPPPPPPDTGEQPAVERAPTTTRRPRRRAAIVGGGIAAAVAATVGVVALTSDGDPGTPVTTGPATTAAAQYSPRPHSGFYAVQVLEDEGDAHLLTIDPDGGADDVATDRPGARDTEADWHRDTNWLAFRRDATSGSCAGLCYVVPDDDAAGIAGKQVAQLVPRREGTYVHAPAWGRWASLFYAMSAGCPPGPGCQEEIRWVQFDLADDGSGYDDSLTATTDSIVRSGLQDVRDLAANPHQDLVVLADGEGVALVALDGFRRLDTSIDVDAVTYTADGNRLVALGTLDGRSTLEIWNSDGTPLQTFDPASSAQTYVDAGGSLFGLDVATTAVASVTAGREGGLVSVILDDADAATSPVLAAIQVEEDGSAAITSAAGFPVTVLAAGSPQALAR